MEKSRTPALVTGLLVLGALLRLLLFAVNPPDNAFDDHYGPIELIVQHGQLPARDACWECYHPPAFYLASAGVAQLALDAGVQLATVHKLLQFLSCLFGVLTLPVLWWLLRRLSVPRTAAVAALATACLLPRHIYMSAMHSNDTAAVLGVTVCAWLLLVALQSGFRARTLIALSLALTATVMTKYTGLVVLPMSGVAFGLAWLWRSAPGRTALTLRLALVLILPLAALAAFAIPNVADYGTPFPSNLELFHDDYLENRDDVLEIEFFSFRPWATIGTPILSPDNRAAVWTLVASRMWFDMEPRFLPYTDPAQPGWWDQYGVFLGGDRNDWPGTQALAPLTLGVGSVLIALGLLPLLLMLAGGLRTLAGRWSPWNPERRPETAAAAVMSVLFLANAAGMALTCIKFPYYFSMKAVYVMTALPAYTVLMALGLEWLQPRVRLRRAAIALLTLLFVLVVVHIVHVAWMVSAQAAP